MVASKTARGPADRRKRRVKKEGLPVSRSNCPQNCLGKRQEMKKIVSQLEAMAPMGKDRVTGALDRLFGDDWDGNRKEG